MSASHLLNVAVIEIINQTFISNFLV